MFWLTGPKDLKGIVSLAGRYCETNTKGTICVPSKDFKMPAPMTPDTPRRPTRILVVDDNQPSAMTLTWAMELYGYEVRTCFEGKAALATAHEFHRRWSCSTWACPLWMASRFAGH